MHILKDNGKYFFYNSLTIDKILKPKNYLFNFDGFGNCWLEDIEDFKFPDKIYDVNDILRKYIKLSFDSYNKNLGTLLTGNKGQGKSLTAKLICSEMKLPTIIINKPIPLSVGFVGFFNNIKQDYVLFVDEFEKLFSKGQAEKDIDAHHGQEVFLSFMDGVLTNKHKVLFLLTTNDSVNEFFINRPSRIKFLQEYDELPEELFNLITDDKLINKEFKEDLESNISLINLNIDLLLSIIEDINLFKKPFSEFKEFYNYKFEDYKYEVFSIFEEAETMENICTVAKRIKSTDRYINGFQVEEMVKFTKQEIIFKTTKYVEDKKGVETSKSILMKLIPYRNTSVKKHTF